MPIPFIQPNKMQTNDNRNIVVYCASSPQLDSVYTDAARQLGLLLAENGYTTVCGGGRAGLMAAVIDGATEAGGETIGVIPGFMVERCWNHHALSQTIVTDSMHSRKQTMASMARAAIALPGGCGTLDELFEIITWRQLGLFQGHIVILNINGYYDPLVEMLERMMQQHFMNPDHRNLWHIARSVDEAVEFVGRPIVERPFSQKLD